MKVLMINGSPHANGNTALALAEMKKIFDAEGIETEILHIGNKDIRSCISCNTCVKKGSCVFDDEVNAAAEKFFICFGLKNRCVVISEMIISSLPQICKGFCCYLNFSACNIVRGRSSGPFKTVKIHIFSP